MRLKSVLKSNHDLRKNGYIIINKLHKLEKRKGALKAYRSEVDDTYFFIICIRALIDVIQIEYPKEQEFHKKSKLFLSYLEDVAKRKGRVNKKRIGSFLKTYTTFFKNIERKKPEFLFTNEVLRKWNIECIMAYIATWGNNESK